MAERRELSGGSERQGQRRGLTAIDGANSLVVVLVIVQMWLVSAALEAALAGHDDVTLPAALASGALCFGSLLLYRFVSRIDRQVRRRL